MTVAAYSFCSVSNDNSNDENSKNCGICWEPFQKLSNWENPEQNFPHLTKEKFSSKKYKQFLKEINLLAVKHIENYPIHFSCAKEWLTNKRVCHVCNAPLDVTAFNALKNYLVLKKFELPTDNPFINNLKILFENSFKTNDKNLKKADKLLSEYINMDLCPSWQESLIKIAAFPCPLFELAFRDWITTGLFEQTVLVLCIIFMGTYFTEVKKNSIFKSCIANKKFNELASIIIKVQFFTSVSRILLLYLRKTTTYQCEPFISMVSVGLSVASFAFFWLGVGVFYQFKKTTQINALHF